MPDSIHIDSPLSGSVQPILSVMPCGTTDKMLFIGAGLSDVYLIKADSSGDTLWTKIYGGYNFDGGEAVQQTKDRGYVIAGYTSSFGAGSYDVYLIKIDSSGNIIWSKTYGGNYYDTGESVEQTADGGYIIAGWTESFSAGLADTPADVYLIKTDYSGDTLWTKTYGGTDEDYGHDVQETIDGGYIIIGSTKSFGAGSFDIYLIKTDSSGDTLWTRTYGNNYFDRGWSVRQTREGGYILVGTGTTGPGDVYLT